MRVTPQILLDIICTVLKIPTDQAWIWNQRRAIPEDKKMYVVAGLVSSKAYGNTMRNESVEGGGMNDRLTQYVQEVISIDLFSYTTEASERYPQILAALRSTYSQQAQEKLGLKIAEIPISISDVSEVEGAALIYRISIALNVLRKYDTIVSTQYYDQFEEHTLTEHGEVN